MFTNKNGIYHLLIVILAQNVSLLALELVLHFRGVLSVDAYLKLTGVCKLRVAEGKVRDDAEKKIKTGNDRREGTLPPFLWNLRAAQNWMRLLSFVVCSSAA